MNKKAHVTLLQVLIAVVITGVGIALFIGAANAIVNLWIERDEACGDSKHFVENLAISIDQVVSGKKDYDIEYIDIENSCILYGFGSENGNIEQYRPVSCVGRGCICICTESECSNSVSCMKIDDVKLINDIDKPFSAKGFKKLYIYKSDDVVIITEKRPAFLGEEVVVEETEQEKLVKAEQAFESFYKTFENCVEIASSDCKCKGMVPNSIEYGLKDGDYGIEIKKEDNKIKVSLVKDVTGKALVWGGSSIKVIDTKEISSSVNLCTLGPIALIWDEMDHTLLTSTSYNSDIPEDLIINWNEFFYFYDSCDGENSPVLQMHDGNIASGGIGSGMSDDSFRIDYDFLFKKGGNVCFIPYSETTESVDSCFKTKHRYYLNQFDDEESAKTRYDNLPECVEPEETSVSLIGLDWDLPFDYILTGTQIIFLNDVEYKNDKFNYPGFEGYNPVAYLDRYKSLHRGVDINADAGISVKAIADGEVIKVSSCTYVLHKGQGIYSNKEYTSIYCHVNGDESLIGKEVKKGDVIGTVLNMGESSHLHLEMYNKRVEVAAYSSYYRECGCSNDDECDNMLTKTGGACEILENDNYLIDGGKFFGLY